MVLVERVGCLLGEADVLARVLAEKSLLDRAAKSFSAQGILAESPGGCVPVQIAGESWGRLPTSFHKQPEAIRVIR